MQDVAKDHQKSPTSEREDKPYLILVRDSLGRQLLQRLLPLSDQSSFLPLNVSLKLLSVSLILERSMLALSLRLVAAL